MNKFLTNNGIWYRFARTVVQGIVGFIVSNIDMLIGTLNFTADTKAIIIVIVMAILAPVMKALGMEDEKVRDNA